MLKTYLLTRSDRFIASGRVAIAAFALAAIWIDRPQTASAPDLVYVLLIAYLALAGGLLVTSRRERAHTAEIALGSHLADLAVFATLTFLTEGPTSPFFLLFTFSLVSATLRWQWKGALWTAIAVLILLVLIALVYSVAAPSLPFRVEQFLIRCGHVVVTGAMLVYFGFHQQRAAEETARLASWQPDPALGTDSRALLDACLTHVANVFSAPRVMLMLRLEAESRASLSVWEHGRFRQDPLNEETLETVVPAALAAAGIIRRATGDILVAGGHGRLSLWHGAELGPAPASLDLDQFLSVPIHSEHATGRLFVADKQDFAPEELTLASLVAVQIGVLLDRLHVIESAQQAAATEERLRLARDLHDGILQTLAGTALQLESIRRLTEQEPAAVPAKINDMQSWLLNEQREMRGFIGKLRPPGPWVRSASSPEHSDLVALVRALERQWGVAISVPAETAKLSLPPSTEFHVRHIVREAIANAVRHGDASEISLRLERGDRDLSLELTDNGSGLPIHGRFDTFQCAQGHIGPRSLRERIVGLGGSLVIDSTPAGVTLSIKLPSRSPDAPDSDHTDRR